MEIINQIQSELISEKADISNTLRKAKVLAYNLQSKELTRWVNWELDGYEKLSDLPDYRILNVACYGKWTNGYWIVNGRQVPLNLITDNDIKKMLSKYPVYDGIKFIREFAEDDRNGHYFLKPELVGLVNHYVQENDYGYMELEYALDPRDFVQIIDTVKNRLLDFILELGEKWKINNSLPAKDIVQNLVSLNIYNNQSQGVQMPTTFDQRGQIVTNQYNAANDIVINASNKDELVKEIERLQDEIEKVKSAGEIEKDTAIGVEYNLVKAKEEAIKNPPNKKKFADFLNEAKKVLSSVASASNIVIAISKIIQIAQEIL